MQFYTQSQPELLKYFDTDPAYGLSSDQIMGKIGQYGENSLKKSKKRSYLSRFAEQFKDAMILILLAAAAVSFVLALESGEMTEFFEPLLILTIVVANACIGVMQETKAERALASLDSLSVPHARVLRDGKLVWADAQTLVPGDILCPQPGDVLAADARLIESVSVKCDESALTGESTEVEKDAFAPLPENTPLAERTNMLFSGCCMTSGKAKAVVTATGMDTELGKIAGLLNRDEARLTPLQQKLARLGKNLGVAALAACGVIFAVGLADGMPPLDIFMTSVSLAVSAIPEGLPAIVTVILSVGVQRMARKNALIRRLSAVETLGGASVICTDKTGTLTQNRMTVTRVYAENALRKADSPVARTLLTYAALCCGDEIKENRLSSDDPTEKAVLKAASDAGLENLCEEYERIAVFPFDSERKRMSVVVRHKGRLYVIVKGAYDRMLSCFKKGSRSEQGVLECMSNRALRVLAVGIRELPALPKSLTADAVENELCFVGLIGMTDPARPEVAQAVQVCKNAGITPVLITGDHPATAEAVAAQTGILTDEGMTVTGAELDAMSEDELDKRLEKIRVYARVSPENKLRIVKAWQKRGKTVAMTGDGVNDAPALKAADIGCAMGKGTDVAKDAADMVLTDENFSTIVDAVREGRGIYANIRKVVGFLLGTNIGEVISVFAAMLLWQEAPLVSIQLLWINLVTDGLPAVALGMEGVEKEIMDELPKPRSEGLFAHGLGVRVVLQGCMFAFLTLTAYAVGKTHYGTVGGRTMAFAVLALSQIVQAYNMRSERSLFHIGLFRNKKLNSAAGFSVLLVCMVLFTGLRNAFGLTLLRLSDYALCLFLILVPFAVEEAVKASKRFLKIK